MLIAIMVLVMAVGTAMDMTPTILIITPVLMPVVKANAYGLGVEPIALADLRLETGIFRHRRAH